MRTSSEIRYELLLKEVRAAYWERNHMLPTLEDLENLDIEVMI